MSNAKPQLNLALLAESLDTKDLLNEDFVEMLTEAIHEEYGDLSEEQLNELFAGLKALGGAAMGGFNKAAGNLATRAATAVGNVAGRVAGAVGGAVKDAKFKYYEAEINNVSNKLGQMVQKLAKDYPAQQKFVGTELKNIEAALQAVLQTLGQPAQAEQGQAEPTPIGQPQMAGLMREGSKKKALNEVGEAPEGGGGDIPEGFAEALSTDTEGTSTSSPLKTTLLKLIKFSDYLSKLNPLQNPQDVKEAVNVSSIIINEFLSELEYFQRNFIQSNPSSKTFFLSKNRWTALTKHLTNLNRIRGNLSVTKQSQQNYIQPAQAVVLSNLTKAVMSTYLR